MVVNLEVSGVIVYGNKGFVADGADNIAYPQLTRNFAYIGQKKMLQTISPTIPS